MRCLPVTVLLTAACSILFAQGKTVRRIETLRPLHVDTVLGAGGKPGAIVAAAATGARLAQQIIARIKR